MAIIHNLSNVQSIDIGSGTKIWQYCVVLSGAQIGADCNICSHVFIEDDVIIGDRVTVKCGVQLWNGLRVENDVFIGPNVTFTNDIFPRSKKKPNKFAVTKIHSGTSIGANATILPGITIGREAMIAAGSVVTRDVPSYACVKGNPARISGYINKNLSHKIHAPQSNFIDKSIKGVDVIKLNKISDMRGDLLAVDLQKQIPFSVNRIFTVMNVPSHHIRGEHAHLKCHQLIICLQGSVTVAADNGNDRCEWVLNHPENGLHIHPMTWASQYRYTPDAVLFVFASHSYDSADYIRDYEEYLLLLKSGV
jgi:acetyltransferase-like isoleucine patch superfamily enzyme/dTDP-4-dehydrorhamnose 3,5-epimerase-like enzyme